MKKLKAVDFCCGAGGWAEAARGLPIEFIAVADLEADALETWTFNHGARHPDCQMLLGDLSSTKGINNFIRACRGVDVFLGGIPCEQVSSIRSIVKTTEKTMTTWRRLIDHCYRAVIKSKARYQAIEDVIQIEKHTPLPLMVGIDLPPVRIDSSRFGPQKRIRTFLGHFPEPIPEPGPRTLAEILRPGPFLTLSKQEERKIVNCSKGFKGDEICAWHPDKPGRTVTTSGDKKIGDCTTWLPDGRVRNLDWREMAALQGFPDDYCFVVNTSHRRALKMIAQAIPIYVGRAILKAICRREGLIA